MVTQVALSNTPIDVHIIQESVRDTRHGGVVTFVGEVRAITGDRLTDRLFYEAHETMAMTQMQKIAEQESDRFEANVAIVHRLGELHPGDVAVVCVAACGHRNAAFECCKNLIDRIKQDVPIWKKEFGPSGEEWIS